MLVFLIRRFQVQVQADLYEDRFTWTLHRKYKDGLGDAICRSAETYASERQARASINRTRRGLGGIRFAATQVDGDA